MRAICEKILLPSDSSWRFHKYQLDYLPFHWHYHPEFEICLTLNSEGMRHIGDHIEPYDDLDLVLVGPNLAHTWQSKPNSNGTQQIVYVAQIPTRWLENLINQQQEFAPYLALLNSSMKGVKFSKACAQKAKILFEDMNSASPRIRLVKLIELFEVMLQDHGRELLASSGFTYCYSDDKNNDKLTRVIDYIYDNFTQPLYAEQLAELAHMSTNHFHRYFKQRTEMTLTDFINRLRIGKACKLLLQTSSPISVISDQCGFNNVSNFNRRFLAIKNCTPRTFRKQLHGQNLLAPENTEFAA